MEEWKDIPRYEGHYQVSSHGRVRSLRRVVVYSNGKQRVYPSKVLVGSITWRGYRQVILCTPDNNKTFPVHRLVADVFLKKDESRPHVNHKDGDKANNKAENLEWCTPKENTQNAIKRGAGVGVRRW